MEFVFINDCTRSDSIEKPKVCMTRFPQQAAKVKIIHHHKDRGLSTFRQTASEVATDDAVTIMDSNGFLEPNAIILPMGEMVISSVDIVEGAYYRMGCKYEKIVLPTHTSEKRRIKTLLWHEGSGSIWGKLCRKDLPTQHDINLTEGVDYDEDHSALPHLLLVGRRMWISDMVYTYRTNRLDSYSTTQSLKPTISLAEAIGITETFFLRKDSQGVYR